MAFVHEGSHISLLYCLWPPPRQCLRVKGCRISRRSARGRLRRHPLIQLRDDVMADGAGPGSGHHLALGAMLLGRNRRHIWRGLFDGCRPLRRSPTPCGTNVSRLRWGRGTSAGAVDRLTIVLPATRLGIPPAIADDSKPATFASRPGGRHGCGVLRALPAWACLIGDEHAHLTGVLFGSCGRWPRLLGGFEASLPGGALSSNGGGRGAVPSDLPSGAREVISVLLFGGISHRPQRVRDEREA